MISELRLKLITGVERVVLDNDCPEAQHCIERDDVLWGVRHDERDPVASANAKIMQALRHTSDTVTKLAVGRGGAEEGGGRTIRVL